MQAVVWTEYGPPAGLQLREVGTPAPKENEVLIRVHATTVTAGDCEVRTLKFPFWLALPMRAYIGLRRPTRITILGQELAGEVAAVGNRVTRFQVGDAVFGSPGFSMGAYAEYATVPADGEDAVLARKPANVSFAEAATLPVGALEALHFLRQAALQPGERLLINGAGGSIGTMAVQLAKAWGAHVTAVDSGAKLAMLRTVGADDVIDYTREDFTARGDTYDVIFDIVGKSPYARSVKALKPHGRYLIANPRLGKMLRGWWTSKTSDKRVFFQVAAYKAADLEQIKELVEAGTLKPVIDRRYPLAATAEAHVYVDSGAKQGSVVIDVLDGGD
ncbi:MAG: NAD(P)-dependent alcohol dehydrogenase [Caldilineaceae bacterium]